MGRCLILTVVFELEVDTLHVNSRLAAIEYALDTNLSTDSLLCQTTIWRQVCGSNITSQFQLFNKKSNVSYSFRVNIAKYTYFHFGYLYTF